MAINKFGSIAKNMAVGTFAILNNGSDASGYNTAFTETSPNHYTIHSYSYKMSYDPLWRRVLILGDGAHWEVPPGSGIVADTSKFACYELDYDRWTLLPYTPGTLVGNLHIYGLQCTVSKPGGVNWLFRLGGNNTRIHYWGTDHADPQTIAHLGEYGVAPGGFSDGSVSRGNLEYFPERDELLFHYSGLGQIYVKPPQSGSWTLKTTQAPALQGDGVAMAYNPVSKVVVWGGGAGVADNPKWWRYDATGTITALDDFVGPGSRPSSLYFSSFGMIAADPGSGKFVIVAINYDDLTKVRMWQLDPLAASGSQWTRLASGIENAWPGDIYSDATSNTTCCPIPEYNVILFSATNKTWLYKHGAGLSFTQKASVKGVLSSHPFSSQSELKPTWQGHGTAHMAPLDAYMQTLGSGIGYDFPYPYSLNRLPTEGNTVCYLQPVSNAMGVPIIDGANGIRFTVPSRSLESNGQYNANFDDILHTDPNTAVAINPTSPHGRVFYIQMKVKADAAYWAAQYRQHDDFTVNVDAYAYPGLYGVACLAGSDILAVPASTPAYNVFTSAYVGKEVYLQPGSPAWDYGFYFITQFIDAQHVRLDRSPCPTADGYGGFMNIEGTVAGRGPYLLPGGPKLCVLTGNPPNYGDPSYVVKLKQNQSEVYFNGPQIVQGATGMEPINANLNRTLLWDQTTYNELTLRIEVGAVTPSTVGWRITWWLNGVKDDPQTDWYNGTAGNTPTGFWSASPSVGFGWFQIAFQMTHKDPTQHHADGTVWIKDVIISQTPIQMNSAVGTAAPDIPAAPCMPWFMRS